MSEQNIGDKWGKGGIPGANPNKEKPKPLPRNLQLNPVIELPMRRIQASDDDAYSPDYDEAA